MQVSELYNLLEGMNEKDYASCLVRSLRKDQLVWTFLTQSDEVATHKIEELIHSQKLNPGTLGLLAFNPEIIQSGYPVNPLPVQILEECMVAYESFLQRHTPPETLEEAARLAIVLIEKKKISTAWIDLLLEINQRMPVAGGNDLFSLWGTVLLLTANLIEDQVDLFSDLLQIQQTDQGISLLVHALTGLPIPEEKTAEILNEVTQEAPVEIAEKILYHLLSIQERNLAVAFAQLYSEKLTSVEEEETNLDSILDDQKNALKKSLLYRQSASIAQLRGIPIRLPNCLKSPS